MPAWFIPSIWRQLPATQKVRLIRVEVREPGYRTRCLHLATTLLDPAQVPASQAAAWYLRCWQVELFFDDLKTSLGLETLRCKSPRMVARELVMHQIAYHLVRQLMRQAEALRPAPSQGVLSFKGTLDRLGQWQWAIWSATNTRQARTRCQQLLETIAHDPVPPRPGRREPRCRKRRPNSYQMLTLPRHRMREIPHRHKYRAPKPNTP